VGNNASCGKYPEARRLQVASLPPFDGKVGTYNNKPQLVVDGSAQLKVLEENEKK